MSLVDPLQQPTEFVAQAILQITEQSTPDGLFTAVASVLVRLHQAGGCQVSAPAPRFSFGASQAASGRYVLCAGAMARSLQVHDANRLDADSAKLGAQLVQIAERWLMAIEQVIHLSKDLQDAARVDNLTGVANRRFFIDELDRRAGATGEGRALACLFIDIRGFKSINDHLGHEVGDELLFEVAARMKHMLRDHDLVARLGKDQFGVLLDNLASEEHVERVVQRLTSMLAQPPIPVDGWQGAAVGIAIAPGVSKNGGDLLDAAEQAMTRAKAANQRFEYFA